MTFLNVPVHPIVVHVPLALAVLLPALTLIMIHAIQRAWLPEHAWAGVIALAGCGAASALVAASTGHWEERLVRQVVERAIVHEHEERADVFVWSFVVLSGVACLPLVPLLHEQRRPLRHAAAAAAFVVAGLAAWVGQSGGELVYRYDAPQAYLKPPATSGLSMRDAANHAAEHAITFPAEH